MAKIKHFFREEDVWTDCNDRGCEFRAQVRKNVEHYCCSECGTEVDKSSKFCSACGEKLAGIAEEYKNIACVICGSKEKQMAHEERECCTRCDRLLHGKRGIELAKAFYALGREKN